MRCETSELAVNAKDCGVTKGCWFVPDGCVDQNTGSVAKCLNGATWKPVEDGVIFELSTSVEKLMKEASFLGKYISLALSYDEFMVGFIDLK